jgi:streptomycin 6-kinase
MAGAEPHPRAGGLSANSARSLEPLARRVARDWGLDLEAAFPLSNYSYVAVAGEEAVLKVRRADDDESDHEADALAVWDGNGAVRLLRRDDERRALLLERAVPGSDISTLPEELATAIVVGVGRRLWRPAGEPFRWIGDHVGPWLDEAGRAARSGSELIPLARELFASLNPGRAVLIHGDLHHHNVLDAGRGYVAIDPKPMLGEPEYDVPSFLWNPIGSRMSAAVTERRLEAFAAAGLDQGRMRAWAVIRAAYLGVDPDETAILRGLVG